MKSLTFNSPASFLIAAVLTAGALASVSAQTYEHGVAGTAGVGKPRHEKEVRRVPPAGFYKEESGGVVYTINGNESWRRTGIEVKRGQKIEILAVGIVRWAPDGIEKIDVGPDGTRPPYRDGWNYYHFPFPEAGIGSLVMRIGKGIYPAGASVVVEAEDSGFIEFMINDDRLDDNSGQFHVKVNVKPLEN
jgi:hypothetical protein